MARLAHILLIVPLLVHGGVLRACQLHDVLGARCERTAPPGSDAVVPAVSPTPCGDERPHPCTACACEYRKGLTQPGRLGATCDLQPAATAADFVTVAIEPGPAGRGTHSPAAPEPPDARRSLPLLI